MLCQEINGMSVHIGVTGIMIIKLRAASRKYHLFLSSTSASGQLLFSQANTFLVDCSSNTDLLFFGLWAISFFL